MAEEEGKVEYLPTKFFVKSDASSYCSKRKTFSLFSRTFKIESILFISIFPNFSKIFKLFLKIIF